MPSFASSFCSGSSLSYSVASTSLNNRLDTIFKKAKELSILCEIEVCVIYYGPSGELKTWPEEKQNVRDIALRYSQLDEAQRHKKSVDLYGFLNKKNDKEMMNNLKKKAKKTSFKNMNELRYPITDNYSPDQISQLIQSLEVNLSTLQERLRLVESQRHKDTKFNHQNLNSIPLQIQNPSLNPSQFSLLMYNHEDATLSQTPLSASNFNKDFSKFLQESGLTNQLMNKSYDQKLCMNDITKNNFQLACDSNKQDYLGFPVIQESGLENQLIQRELYGCYENMCLGNINSNDFQHQLCDYDQNVCMTDITNNNSQNPCFSNPEHYKTEQESVDDLELNQFIQNELCGYDQNMFTSDITNCNIPDSYFR